IASTSAAIAAARVNAARPAPNRSRTRPSERGSGSVRTRTRVDRANTDRMRSVTPGPRIAPASVRVRQVRLEQELGVRRDDEDRSCADQSSGEMADDAAEFLV